MCLVSDEEQLFILLSLYSTTLDRLKAWCTSMDWYLGMSSVSTRWVITKGSYFAILVEIQTRPARSLPIPGSDHRPTAVCQLFIFAEGSSHVLYMRALSNQSPSKVRYQLCPWHMQLCLVIYSEAEWDPQPIDSSVRHPHTMAHGVWPFSNGSHVLYIDTYVRI